MYKLGKDIWIHDGPEITGIAGFHYPTRMVVIQLAQGGLWVWSPVALDEDLRTEIDRLGPVHALIAPNAFHDSHLATWAAAYPEAQLHAAPRLRGLRPDISFHAELSDTPPADWAGEIDQIVVPGSRMIEEVVFFHRPSGTVIFCDLLQQLPKDWYRGWRRIIARLDGMSGPEPQVPRKFRLSFRDRAAAKGAVTRIMNWPAKRLVIAHGPIVEDRATDLIRRAFQFLSL